MNRFVRIIFLATCLTSFNTLYAQCVQPDFTLQAGACMNEMVQIENTLPDDGSLFEWDFCSGDLETVQGANEVLSHSNFFRARSIRVIQEGSFWYAFTISATANILMRLDFGAGPTSVPSFNNLGNVGGALNSAFAFDMIKEDGIWHLFVANGGEKNILRYSFTDGVEENPSLSILQTPVVFEAAGPNSIRLVKDVDHFFAFVSVGTTVATSKIVRLDFGNSILNLTPSLSEFTISSSSQLRGMSFVKECGQWMGFAISQSTNALYRLDFGNSLSNNPASSVLNTAGLLNTPINIEVRNEGGLYYAFVQNSRIEETNAALYRISFGESITSTSVTTEKLMFPQLTGGAYALDIANVNSKWYAFTFNLTTNNLIRFDYENDCGTASPISSYREPPLFNYSAEGSYTVTLKKTDVEGNSMYKSKSIIITALQAPDIAFISQNLCANHDVNFTSQNTSGNIVSYDWDFGDANSSSQSNPIHQYAATGEYVAQLNVEADNGCNNLSKQSITIYNEPVAGFLLPVVDPVCTNQTYLFQNSSSYDAGYLPVWEWTVNGSPVSTAENLNYVFESTDPHEIRLKGSIPGCDDEYAEVINSLAEGPAVEFTFTGQCEEETVMFSNATSGSVTGYIWDFSDGQFSTDENPEHIFTFPDQYQVTLTASNAAGCQNTSTKQINIYSKPQTDFSAPLPPFSCSGLPTQFSDLTPGPFDSNITSWLWDFDDGGVTSRQRNPQHTYESAGDYQVSLTATTNVSCSATLQKIITITQTPVPDFTNTAPCRGVPVIFTDVSVGNVQSRLWQIETASFTEANPVFTFGTSGPKNISLSVTDANGCIGSMSEALYVPTVLTPDFTFTKNCVDQQTEFTDVTDAVADPVVSRQWTFTGVGTGFDNPQVVTFANPGNYSVRLAVTTETGCEYAVQKNVAVLNSPQANFLASPSFGAPPLQVQFTNTSINASGYLWRFNDAVNSMSTLTSPSFTFTELGEYAVNLTAFNEQSCLHTLTKTIQVVVPFLNITLDQLELITLPDNALKPAVSIHNMSNVPVSNLPVRFDFSGGTTIRDYVDVSILPGTTYRHIVGFDIPGSAQLNFICAEAEIADGSPEDNKVCLTIQNPLFIFAPYPNPVSGNSGLNVEWIATEQRSTEISLLNALGQTIISLDAESVPGFNSVGLSTEGLQAGMYFMRIVHEGSTSSFRIMVAE